MSVLAYGVVGWLFLIGIDGVVTSKEPDSPGGLPVGPESGLTSCCLSRVPRLRSRPGLRRPARSSGAGR